MRLNRSGLAALSQAIIKELADSSSIELSNAREAAADLESVLSNYLNLEQAASDEARSLVQSRGVPESEYGRVKRLSADKLGIKVGDDGLDFVLDQLVEMLMHSGHVEEVFAADHDLRRLMRRHLMEAAELESQAEADVRGKLKHVQEGSRLWEIEYRRMKEDIKRRRGS
ncbi:MAG: DUF507 family protein [Myxococcales bacterium]|nr:DUF507 family protein [Myxococcales bacterium]